MRIGVLTTSYPREADDPAGHFVRGLCLYLADRGHRVEIVAAGEGSSTGAVSSGPMDGPLRVRRVPSPLFYRGGAPDALAAGRGPRVFAEAAGFSGRLLLECQRELRTCDALLSHWLVPCGVAAALCAAGRPHVAVAHSSDVHLLRRLGLTAVVRWLSRRARLVYTSESLRIPGAAGEVVPMGLDTASYAAAEPERLAARAALALRKKTILVLARLVPVKGLDVLLAALGRLIGQGADVELLIAGAGPLRSELETLTRDAGLGAAVRFLGEVRGAQKRRLLIGCDVLALPSRRLADGRTESAPTVLLEALASGCPVVASDVGGARELLGDAGTLVPPEDPGALAAALRAILEDPDRAALLRRRGPVRARGFDWSRVAPRLLGPAFLEPAPPL